MRVPNLTGGRLRAVLVGVLLSAVGIVGGVLGAYATLSAAATLGVPIDEGSAIERVVSQVGQNAVGFGGVSLGYLTLRQRGVDPAFVARYLRVRRPTLRDLGWVLAGFGLVFAALVVFSLVTSVLGAETATSSGIEEGRENPTLFLVGIPLALLFVGPGEELLFRGVVQSRLRENFSAPVAVVAAGVCFAVPHLLGAYTGDGALTSIALITAVGVALGAVYEHTGNLVIPAVVHGLFNATVYALNYL